MISQVDVNMSDVMRELSIVVTVSNTGLSKLRLKAGRVCLWIAHKVMGCNLEIECNPR